MDNNRLEMAEKRLNAYYKAEIAVLSGQEYRLGTRSLKKADLGEIRQAIKELENLVSSLKNNNGKRKVFRILPRDL